MKVRRLYTFRKQKPIFQCILTYIIKKQNRLYSPPNNKKINHPDVSTSTSSSSITSSYTIVSSPSLRWQYMTSYIKNNERDERVRDGVLEKVMEVRGEVEEEGVGVRREVEEEVRGIKDDWF